MPVVIGQTQPLAPINPSKGDINTNTIGTFLHHAEKAIEPQPQQAIRNPNWDLLIYFFDLVLHENTTCYAGVASRK
jgi:hypothetical protein